MISKLSIQVLANKRTGLWNQEHCDLNQVINSIELKVDSDPNSEYSTFTFWPNTLEAKGDNTYIGSLYSSAFLEWSTNKTGYLNLSLRINGARFTNSGSWVNGRPSWGNSLLSTNLYTCTSSDLGKNGTKLTGWIGLNGIGVPLDKENEFELYLNFTDK